MNRQQRRKATKKGLPVSKDPVYNLKQSDVAKMKSEATETAITLLLSIPIKVMHEEFGWGMRKRLPRLADALIDEYQKFADGEMTLEEYQDMVYEYCGVKFKKNEEE